MDRMAESQPRNALSRAGAQTPRNASANKIIFDMDLTLGVTDCDMDDGLALLFAKGFALEHKTACIEAVCTSYGNSNQETVYAATEETLRRFEVAAPLFKGAATKDQPDSTAAQFLADAARSNPGQFSLSVTGSTTNLKGALRKNPDALPAFKEVVFMGGITEPLTFPGGTMGELNLSCDPEATAMAFEAANQGARITVITANNCLPAFFTKERFESGLAPTADKQTTQFILQTGDSWFGTMRRWYDLEGFHCWDVLVPAYILMPELFIDEDIEVSLDEELLSQGRLQAPKPGQPSACINAPHIADPETFMNTVFHYWNAALAGLR